VLGILTIFAWRIFAKFLMHRILPPTFRFLGQLMTLPHRRFYTPATDYEHVPPEKGLHPIPSVLDLPGMLELEVDGVSTARTTTGRQDLKLRPGRGSRSENVMQGNREGLGLGLEEQGGKEVDVVKHYDADGEWLSC
jgi:dihydrosphingosine 1-phosphate phosphatase